MNKKETILSSIIFFFGIVLFVFAFGMLIYQIIHTIFIDWRSITNPEAYKATRNYVIVEFLTIAFKLVVSIYAINCRKHLDDAINPLFTFTCLYLVFVVLQSVLYFTNGGVTLELTVSANAFIDMIISAFFFVITFVLKLDDWIGFKEI